MTAHVFGIDICDYSTSIVSYADDKAFRFPTAICKEKDADGWYVGEEAYAMALSGRGVIVSRGGNSQILFKVDYRYQFRKVKSRLS